MSNRELKKIKKELININNQIYRHKFILKALNGLYLVDLSKTDIGKVVPVEEVPKGMTVEVIGANIDDIIICGGVGYDPIFIINDIPSEDIETTIHTINIKPISSREEALSTM